MDAGVVDAGSRVDAGVVDAGSDAGQDADAGVLADAGLVMSADAGVGLMPAQPGCGCAATSASSLWALFVGVALLSRRRERR